MANKMLTRFLEGNAKFAQTYTAPPPLMKLRDQWIKNGAKGAVILSCSDPRVIPEKFLGLESGPSAVIRNAGGRAMDAMRSLLVLHTINPLGLILVVHHTDCGTTHVADSEVRQNIKKMAPSLDGTTVDESKFGEITDLEGSIREDVALIQNDPQFGGRAPDVVGLLYDIETGAVRQVE